MQAISILAQAAEPALSAADTPDRDRLTAGAMPISRPAATDTAHVKAISRHEMARSRTSPTPVFSPPGPKFWSYVDVVQAVDGSPSTAR